MTGTDLAEALYEKLAPEVRALIQELRGVVRTAIPQATERVHLGYSNILYLAGANMRSMILALDPQRGYVNVEFHDGVELPDPANKLEGTGKTLRHVKVRSTADAHTPELAALIAAQAEKRGLGQRS